MKDGYRYFISRPTAEDGDPVPVLASAPNYFRVDGRLRCGTFFNRHVCFWDGNEWRSSAIQPFFAFLDAVLGSGATVRELIEEKEIPGV